MAPFRIKVIEVMLMLGEVKIHNKREGNKKVVLVVVGTKLKSPN